MANYDLQDVMKRLPVLQKAALGEIAQKCDAVAYWPYQQEFFPYFWNRIEGMTVEEDVSGDLNIHRYQVSMALVIGHLVEAKYVGLISELAYPWIGQVLNYFRQYNPSHLMDGSEYTSAPDWLWTEEGGARIVGIPNGTRTLANSGVGNALQIAVVFTLEVPLLFELY